MRCFNCQELGHVRADCPASSTRGSHGDHLAIIDTVVGRWRDGEISIERKRHLISDENHRYYGSGCRKALLYP